MLLPTWYLFDIGNVGEKSRTLASGNNIRNDLAKHMGENSRTHGKHVGNLIGFFLLFSCNRVLLSGVSQKKSFKNFEPSQEIISPPMR
jgi:hypothetical protein